MMNAATRISVAVIAAAFGLGLAAATASAGEGGTQKARVVAQNGHSAAHTITAKGPTDPTRVQLTEIDHGK